MFISYLTIFSIGLLMFSLECENTEFLLICRRLSAGAKDLLRSLEGKPTCYERPNFQHVPSNKPCSIFHQFTPWRKHLLQPGVIGRPYTLCGNGEGAFLIILGDNILRVRYSSGRGIAASLIGIWNGRVKFFYIVEWVGHKYKKFINRISIPPRDAVFYYRGCDRKIVSFIHAYKEPDVKRYENLRIGYFCLLRGIVFYRKERDRKIASFFHVH